MPPQRTIVLVDGQNLYHGVREAWAPDPPVPGNHVERMAQWLVDRKANRVLRQIRFYTGVPKAARSPLWSGFWNNKLRYLTGKGVYVYRGRINKEGDEKGVDVSIAIDLIKLTYNRDFDVAIIISQDTDYIPAVKLAKVLARTEQKRHIGVECAYPDNPATPRGIAGTEWIRILKPDYDNLIDPREYRNLPGV